jgi:Cys-tRNA(Pro)/Cys-tRNA(Cys) deacylase
MELEKYLEKNNVWHKFIDKPETIHTADAANKSGIDLKRITKSLVLLNQDKEPIMAIIPGDQTLDLDRVKIISGSKKIRMVPFNEAENYSGYLPGATPMIHHKVKMKVIIERALTKCDTVFGGGGERTKLLELKVDDIIKLNNAIVGDVVENRFKFQ